MVIDLLWGSFISYKQSSNCQHTSFSMGYRLNTGRIHYLIVCDVVNWLKAGHCDLDRKWQIYTNISHTPVLQLKFSSLRANPLVWSLRQVKLDSMRKSLYQKQTGTLNFFHLLAQKRNLEKNSICSNKFFHIFHLSESSFTCLRLQASGLAHLYK
jgi:hypothetical protein